MYIAAIAHEGKRELMAQLFIAYEKALEGHNISATSGTWRYITSVSDLEIKQLLSDDSNGEQQLASLLSCNEIDLVIYFRETAIEKPDSAGSQDILRLCDMHNIPIATNLASAEILIRAMENGELDWRELVNPLYKK